MDALVTDAEYPWALAGLRALGRAGVHAAALGAGRSPAGLLSRYAAGRATAPRAELDAAGFVSAVSEFARRRGPLLVYPCDERSLDALLHAGEALAPEARLPYPDARALELLRDKRALADVAKASGLRIPQTLLEGTASELRGTRLPASCVIKPVRKNADLPTRVVDGRHRLEELLEQIPGDEPLLLQEKLEPPLVGLSLVLDRGSEPVAVFQQRAVRTWPPDAGGSSLAVGVDPDPALVDRAAGLLGSVGYWGLAQMQFLRGRDGLALIDVNTRFYGSLPLATESGVNLPATWHAIAGGRAPPRTATYRPGVTYRRLEADLTAAFRGHRRLLLQRAPRPRVGAVWAADDPLPSVALALSAVWTRLRRRLP